MEIERNLEVLDMDRISQVCELRVRIVSPACCVLGLLRGANDLKNEVTGSNPLCARINHLQQIVYVKQICHRRLLAVHEVDLDLLVRPSKPLAHKTAPKIRFHTRGRSARDRH
jgi:hypothetical protein